MLAGERPTNPDLSPVATRKLLERLVERARADGERIQIAVWVLLPTVAPPPAEMSEA